MQCSETMTDSCYWVKAVLFVLCLVDLCDCNLNLYLTQSEVRRLLGKSFQTCFVHELRATLKNSEPMDFKTASGLWMNGMRGGGEGVSVLCVLGAADVTVS
jgi:hypothetical protein